MITTAAAPVGGPPSGCAHAPASPVLIPRRGTVLTRGDDADLIRLTAAGRTWEDRMPSAALAAALVDLEARPRTAAELLTACAEPGLQGVMAVQTALLRLQGVGVLDHVVLDAEGRAVARLTGEGSLPVAPGRPAPVVAGALSRLAVLQPVDGGVRIESGLNHLRVEVASAHLASLLTGEAVDEGPTGAGIVALLTAAGLWASPHTEDDGPGVLWSAADLWLHRRLHEGRGADRYGGTYPMRGRIDPLPFVREPAAVSVPLPAAAPDGAGDAEPTLIEAVEGRRSTRAFKDEPVSLEALGALLHRSCRMRGLHREEDGQDVVDRPYPSGGSIHELEVYVVASHVAGLDRGLWRYAPDRHALDLVRPEDRRVTRLADELWQGATLDGRPGVGLVVSARFGRLMWKYETIAYGLILKHVGALYQTLYLNAGAVGLGACALGAASTSSFAAATGEDPLVEGMVGAMLLGVPAGVPESPWSRS